MINFLKKVLGFKHIPSDSEVNALLKKCEMIIERLGKQEDIKPLTTFNSLKGDIDKIKSTDIKIKDNAIDTEEWNKKQEKEKIDIHTKLDSIFRSLKALNRTEIIAGIGIFSVFALIFIALVIGYLCSHKKISDKSGEAKKVNGLVIVEIEKAFKTMEDQRELFNKGSEGDAKAIQKPAKEKAEEKKSEAKEGKDKTKTTPAVKGEKPKKKGEDAKIVQKSFEDGFNELKGILTQEPLSSRLSFKLKKTLGVLEGEKEVKKVKPETLAELQKIVEAEIESLSTQFFWVDTPGKWFEIAFWSLFGVLAGILYFIAGSLKKGIFNMSDVTMMIAEIIITPPVVLIVFFLFPFTDIKTFTPSELSIYMTMGISFILGFAIRRTVGLLDNIKRRLLPDPPNEGAGK
jgi:hypothetical protein